MPKFPNNTVKARAFFAKLEQERAARRGEHAQMHRRAMAEIEALQRQFEAEQGEQPTAVIFTCRGGDVMIRSKEEIFADYEAICQKMSRKTIKAIKSTRQQDEHIGKLSLEEAILADECRRDHGITLGEVVSQFRRERGMYENVDDQ